jgi:hypothetical protein
MSDRPHSEKDRPMRRDQLEHAIRTACQIIVLGAAEQVASRLSASRVVLSGTCV